MNDCSGNVFCRKLPEDLKEALCRNCVKSSYAAGTSLVIDMHHPLVVVEGMFLSTNEGKPLVMVLPGNFVLTPHFAPGETASYVFDDDEIRRFYSDTRYVCFSDVIVGMFTNEAVEELLQDARFLRLVWENTQYQSFFTQLYQSELYHGSAYRAVRFILRCAKTNGNVRLTHEQIAFLSGRNRTTVTKAMHEVALSEPELLEGLM